MTQEEYEMMEAYSELEKERTDKLIVGKWLQSNPTKSLEDAYKNHPNIDRYVVRMAYRELI